MTSIRRDAEFLYNEIKKIIAEGEAHYAELPKDNEKVKNLKRALDGLTNANEKLGDLLTRGG